MNRSDSTAMDAPATPPRSLHTGLSPALSRVLQAGEPRLSVLVSRCRDLSPCGGLLVGDGKEVRISLRPKRDLVRYLRARGADVMADRLEESIAGSSFHAVIVAGNGDVGLARFHVVPFLSRGGQA